MKTSRILAILTALLTALLILSASIAAPIVVRPFYDWQVRVLHIDEATGYSPETIHEAYHEMLDFCMYGTPFGTGSLRWSDAGRSHFADVAKLFRLDFAVCLLSAAGLLLCLLLSRLRRLRPRRLLGRGPGFWAGAGLSGCFLIVGALAALDFDRAFVVFHAIFFPGKENWLFDPQVDEIITILPQAFFQNCAICIAALLLLSCAVLIAADLCRNRHTKPPERG